MVKWLDSTLQTKVTYRKGDIIISSPPKCGTTWTMNICHQLRTGGDEEFKDIYVEIPWPELRERPYQPDEELLERWKALPDPRFFKSHSFAGDGPGSCIKYREDMKYVVVFRNPEEALVSFKLFIESLNMELWELWGVTELRKKFIHPDFPTFFEKCIVAGLPHMPPEMVPPGGVITMFYLGFVNGWWPLRNKPNVLMLHFNDMKADHEGTVRRVAKFLDIQITEEQFSKVLEHTSYKWMKENQDKFEMRELLSFPMINSGGMVRRGEAGKAFKDGMTPEISATIRSFTEQFVKDDEAREWLYKGGPIQSEVEQQPQGCNCDIL